MSPVSVGGFPGMQSHLNRTIRAPVNPMDLSTVVSIFPKALNEKKLTLFPGKFKIEPGTEKAPAVLVVGSSSWWKHIDENQPILEIPQGSNIVADSIVKDYCNGLVGCNMSNSMPGIFWVPGKFDSAGILKDHAQALEIAKKKQDTFYRALIKFADTFWARTNGSPLCINDEMRLAASALGLKDKEWMKDFTQLGKVDCPACGTPVKPGYPICSTCRAVVNVEQAKKLGIQFAVQG